MDSKTQMIAIGAGLGVLLLMLTRGGNIGEAGAALGAAAVDMVDGVVGGAVYAVGDKVGLPDTRQQTVIEQGRAQLAAGNYWDASFNLPAGEFISGVWNNIWE